MTGDEAFAVCLRICERRLQALADARKQDDDPALEARMGELEWVAELITERRALEAAAFGDGNRPSPSEGAVTRGQTTDADRSWVETWPSIAGYLGKSSSWCRTKLHGADPIPVYQFSGRVRAEKRALDAWITRQATGLRR